MVKPACDHHRVSTRVRFNGRPGGSFEIRSLVRAFYLDAESGRGRSSAVSRESKDEHISAMRFERGKRSRRNAEHQYRRFRSLKRFEGHVAPLRFTAELFR